MRSFVGVQMSGREKGIKVSLAFFRDINLYEG